MSFSRSGEASIVLTLALLSGLFVGCGGSQQKSEDTVDIAPAASSAPSKLSKAPRELLVGHWGLTRAAIAKWSDAETDKDELAHFNVHYAADGTTHHDSGKHEVKAGKWRVVHEDETHLVLEEDEDSRLTEIRIAFADDDHIELTVQPPADSDKKPIVLSLQRRPAGEGERLAKAPRVRSKVSQCNDVITAINAVDMSAASNPTAANLMKLHDSLQENARHVDAVKVEDKQLNELRNRYAANLRENARAYADMAAAMRAGQQPKVEPLTRAANASGKIVDELNKYCSGQ